MHLSQICAASTQSSRSSSSLWEKSTQTAAVSPPWENQLNISGSMVDDAKKLDAETHQEAKLEEEIDKLQAGEGEGRLAVTPFGAMGAAWTQPSCSTSSRRRQSGQGSNLRSSKLNSTGCMACSISSHQSQRRAQRTVNC